MLFSSLFSALSFIAAYLYIYIGIYTYKLNKKSTTHRMFFALCTSYAIWAFAYSFAYVAKDEYVFSVWNKISALGWCSFSAITLYLVLLITDNRITNKRIVKYLIFLPSIVFFLMAIFLFGYDIETSTSVSSFFYVGDFLYNFLYLLMSIGILFNWGYKSNNKRIKKQSKLLVLSGAIPFILNLITQTILPIIGVNEFPLMGQLYSSIMIIGTYIVITKYKFLKLPESFIAEEILDEIVDMVILINEKMEIIRISKSTLINLGFEEDELNKQKVNLIFEHNFADTKLTYDNFEKTKRYYNVAVSKKSGEKLPVNVSYKPIFDSKIHDFLGGILILQDIRIENELRKMNEVLIERSKRDSLTNLYNHQYSIDILEWEININENCLNKKVLSLMMLDIDYFKRVNDTYGHQYGDYVLQTLSNILQQSIGTNGYVGRYGGEEFIIILPNYDIHKAYDIGELIRNVIKNHKFDRNYTITVSIGIKQYCDESAKELIMKTDELLYLAKKNGRDRIGYNI